MKIDIRARHLALSPEHLEEVHRRIHAALARISPMIRSVGVTIADINGPRGGADKKCIVRVRGRSVPTVVVEHVGVDTLATVARAAERAERAVLTKLARRRLFAPLLAR